MRSSMLFGKTMHARLEPVEHKFVYPIYMWVIDLAELPLLSEKFWFFSYNKPGLYSFYDADYLRPEGDSITEKVLAVLKGKSYQREIVRIECVTTPRYFNWVFNPASFFYCYDEAERIRALVLQVNNTFGERHIYIFDDEALLKEKSTTDYLLPKEFYVSPFNNVSGSYELSAPQPNGKVDIRLNITDEGRTLFCSRVWGKTLDVSHGNFIKTLAKFPLNVFLTTPRILWEGAKLYYAKNIDVKLKPLPVHADTLVVAKPSLVQQLSLKFVLRQLRQMKKGHLRVFLPNGVAEDFGDEKVTHPPQIEIYDYKFFPRLVRGSDVAFGEMYCEQYFDCSDLTGVLRFFVDNLPAVEVGSSPLTLASNFINAVRHLYRRNSPSGSEKNIRAHYDLSNDLFQSFLDPSMTYSSAFFASDADTLEVAQQNKLHKIIEKAQLNANDYVLEIGSGWGSLAMAAVAKTGCRVKTITLSKEQQALARERIAAAGMSDRIEVELCDYRNVEGQFSKIISIEMLEAVGYQYFGAFFRSLEKYLAPDGIAVLQVITLPEQRYERAKFGADWIQQYIFPGSTIPSLGALIKAMSANSGLVVEDVENIGLHYAKTLRLWRENFEKADKRVRALGFDRRFQRMWSYYLAYCEAGFAGRELNDLQIVCSRPNNSKLVNRKAAERL